jgi:hypothetical protein
MPCLFFFSFVDFLTYLLILNCSFIFKSEALKADWIQGQGSCMVGLFSRLGIKNMEYGKLFIVTLSHPRSVFLSHTCTHTCTQDAK